MQTDVDASVHFLPGKWVTWRPSEPAFAYLLELHQRNYPGARHQILEVQVLPVHERQPAGCDRLLRIRSGAREGWLTGWWFLPAYEGGAPL